LHPSDIATKYWVDGRRRNGKIGFLEATGIGKQLLINKRRKLYKNPFAAHSTLSDADTPFDVI
jgi:hypothetical protein